MSLSSNESSFSNFNCVSQFVTALETRNSKPWKFSLHHRFLRRWGSSYPFMLYTWSIRFITSRKVKSFPQYVTLTPSRLRAGESCCACSGTTQGAQAHHACLHIAYQFSVHSALLCQLKRWREDRHWHDHLPALCGSVVSM